MPDVELLAPVIGQHSVNVWKSTMFDRYGWTCSCGTETHGLSTAEAAQGSGAEHIAELVVTALAEAGRLVPMEWEYGAIAPRSTPEHALVFAHAIDAQSWQDAGYRLVRRLRAVRMPAGGWMEMSSDA